MSSILLTESTNMEYITQNGFDHYFFVFFFLYASRLKLMMFCILVTKSDFRLIEKDILR